MRGFDLRLPGQGARTCRVRVGAGALGALVEDLAARPPGRPIFVVSDDVVAPLWGAPLARRLARRGLEVRLLEFPAGERHKSRRTKERLEDRLAASGAGRDCAIVAVGGGVTGDLAGFLAATWHRGVPVVQVPTTLLAMVDAAIGGKTAVNVPAGKNLVGCFHQPWGVYADVDTLATLGERFFVEGFAEALKTAVVADARLFAWLERNALRLGRRDPAALERMIERCLRIKAAVVRSDEREQGRRAMLNFGHTVGHAIEAVTGFALRHGRAVAIGMVVEGRLAVRRGDFGADDLRRIERLLGVFGLPTRVPPRIGAAAVVRASHRDKKVRAGRIRCALPHALGTCATVAVGDAALRAVLAPRRAN